MISLKFNTTSRRCPHGGGVYLVGYIYFDADTQQLYHLIKVGKAKNLESRLNAYMTYNPTLIKIDFLSVPEELISQVESRFHDELDKLTHYKVDGAQEWWIVDSQIYESLLKNGLNFLNKKKIKQEVYKKITEM